MVFIGRNCGEGLDRSIYHFFANDTCKINLVTPFFLWAGVYLLKGFMITYQTEEKLTIEEFKSVLISSTLGERRPVDEPERLAKMLEHGNLIITARDDGKLVGISRSFTDFSFCTYLSDLAVDLEYQKSGIGKELLR